MSLLLDLADDRRSAKAWLPASDKDVSEGRVVPGDRIAWDGRPECVLHGAMNAIAPAEEDESRLYRCQECGVGAQWYPTNSRVSKTHFRQAWDSRVTDS